MYKLTTGLAFLLILFSCNQNKKSNYQLLSEKGYNSGIRYLDKTILNYARISETGEYYLHVNKWLDSAIDQLQDKLAKDDTLSTEERSKFFEQFEKALQKNTMANLKELKELPMNGIADLNTVRLYIKNNIVCELLVNKGEPYDTWSTMATAKKWEIDNGEAFEVYLSNTMYNSISPGGWYLLKDSGKPLVKDNIIDTLHQDEMGTVAYKTNNYRKGGNELVFASRLPDRKSGNTLYKTIYFTVK